MRTLRVVRIKMLRHFGNDDYMIDMKTCSFSLLKLPLACCLVAFCSCLTLALPPPHYTGRTSWPALLANAEGYNENVVTLVGTLAIEGDQLILFASDQDAKMRLFENSILLEVSDPSTKARLKKLVKLAMSIEGWFRVRQHVPSGRFAYTMEFMSVKDFALNSPYSEILKFLSDSPTAEEFKKSDAKNLSTESLSIEGLLKSLENLEPHLDGVDQIRNKFSEKETQLSQRVIGAYLAIEKLSQQFLAPKELATHDLKALKWGKSTESSSGVDPLNQKSPANRDNP